MWSENILPKGRLLKSVCAKRELVVFVILISSVSVIALVVNSENGKLGKIDHICLIDLNHMKLLLSVILFFTIGLNINQAQQTPDIKISTFKEIPEDLRNTMGDCGTGYYYLSKADKK